MSHMQIRIMPGSSCFTLFFAFIVTFFLGFSTPRQAFASNKFSISPEFYHVKRTREGGTRQSGFLFGGQARYERIKGFDFYWGLQASYAKGRISGKGGKGNALRSHLTDREIEGRLGYTFCSEKYFKPFYPSLTLYAGYGYFGETNKFLPPTFLTLKFKDYFNYISGGCLSSLYLTPEFKAGLNFKGAWMIRGRSKISDDPSFDDLSLIMGSKMQYEIEAPLTYVRCNDCFTFELSAVPFAQYRHFGGMGNFPFDFADTMINVFGLRLMFTIY